MAWFDESDNDATVKNHLNWKHIPDSIRDDAKRELIDRGFTKEEIYEIERNEDKNY